MPAGFQSFLPNSQIIQIDGETQQFCLVKSGKLTNSDFAYGGTGAFANPYAVVDVSQWADPIIAIRSVSSQSRVGLWSSEAAGRLHVHKWWNLSIDVPVEYYVFARHRPAGSTYGMQLFDENAQLTFDALWPLMSIVDFIQLPPNTPNLVNEGSYVYKPINNPAGRKLAACISIPSFANYRLMEVNQPLTTVTWFNDNQLGISFVRLYYDETNPSVTGWFNDTANTILLIDVTSLPNPFG